MQIVFIKHAKSENYETNKRQAPDSRLASIGKKQARLVANRIKKWQDASGNNFDYIITSHWARAVETAEIIAKKTGVPVRQHHIIHEYLSNSILANQPLDSEIVLEWKKAVIEKGINFDWKFRGEGECMRDVINRAKAFKDDLINNYCGKNCLVVSHGLFITTFVTLLILGDNYEDASFKYISDMVQLENTSITHLEYDRESNNWKIHYLNDFSHLK